jgi:hypothetical protein
LPPSPGLKSKPNKSPARSRWQVERYSIPEDGGGTFLTNITELPLNYRASHPRRHQSSSTNFLKLDNDSTFKLDVGIFIFSLFNCNEKTRIDLMLSVKSDPLAHSRARNFITMEHNCSTKRSDSIQSISNKVNFILHVFSIQT